MFMPRYAAMQLLVSRHLKIPLPTVDRHQIGHQLPRHRQRRAIGIAFLLFRS